jgi:hypothetical protein
LARPDAPSVGAAGSTARICHGQTLAAKANDYPNYLCEEGVRATANILAHRCVQPLRMVRNDIADRGRANGAVFQSRRVRLAAAIGEMPAGAQKAISR